MTKLIYTVGDSHSRAFASSSNFHAAYDAKLAVHAIGIGMSSARGLIREENTTRSRKKIEREYTRIEGGVDGVCFNFGQVDIEYIYPYRRIIKKTGESFEAFVDDTIEKYMKGIRSFAHLGEHIIVKGANYPVIIDDELAAQNVIRQLRIRGNEAYTRKEIRAYIREIKETTPSFDARCARADLFNERLAEACKQEGYAYFDINEKLIDPKSKKIRIEYLPFGALEHHLANSIQTQKLYIEGLEASYNCPLNIEVQQI